MANMNCYHHDNCEDRPAVSTCSRCGKGLCRECTDNLRSRKTGRVLCVDCLNAELANDVAWSVGVKKILKREAVTIVIGFILGIIVLIVLGAFSNRYEAAKIAFILSFVFFLPTVFASLKTIWSALMRLHWLLRIPAFFVLCLASPIMFIVRIVRRVKNIKLMKRYAVLQIQRREANKKYAEIAHQMSTRKTTVQFEQEMKLKYAALLASDKAKAEMLIAKERADREAAERRRAEQEKLAAEESQNLKNEMDKIRSESEKSERIGKKRAAASRRSTDDVDSGIAA